jgi:hypothetical protein
MHGITIQHIARSIADLSKWVIRSKINPTNWWCWNKILHVRARE